ncbi:MAG: hypothetical protein HDT24_06885 [Ruminococcus sp.]|nr:hypothetical protein [Ruminococcus sp.]
MNDDYDIVEWDFPEYLEEHSAVPDVEDEVSFTEHKEEIYRRNRLIAAEEQAKLLKEAERDKALRRQQTEELIREAESAEAYVIPRKMAVSAVAVVCIVMVVIVALINVNRKADGYDTAEIIAETIVMPETTVSEKVTRVTTERKKRETTVTEEISEETTETVTEASSETTTASEIPPELLKTMTVREPFAADGNSYIYNTAVMSYKFTSEYGGLNEYGVEMYTIHMSVKNLTDYGYFVVPEFRLTNGETGNYQSCSLASYDREHTHFSSSFRYGDDEEWREGSPIAFSFDESGMCEISLNVYFNTEFDKSYDTFEYDSQRGFPKYTENADEGFKIPLSEILKYVK